MNYIDPKQSEVIARLDAQIRTGWVTQIQALYLLGVGRNKFRQIRGEYLEEKKLLRNHQYKINNVIPLIPLYLLQIFHSV